MGATKIMVYLIVALIVVVIMVGTVGGFYATVLFSGAEPLKATSTIVDSLEDACGEKPGFVTTFNVFMPDSMEAGGHKSYFYVALDNYMVLLRTKEEATDVPTQIIDFITNRPGEQPVEEYNLKICRNNDVMICSMLDAEEICSPPNKFQFEPNEGKESLTFKLNRTKDIMGDKVILSYDRGQSPET